MKRLSGHKRVFAITSAALLVAAASGTALAMIDPGLGSARSEQTQRQIRQNASGQAQQSPLPTATPRPTSTPESHGNEVEFRGTVEVIAATGWVIGGRTVQVTGATEIDAGVDVGSEVKVHAQVQADGSVWAREIDLLQVGDDDNGNGNGNENDNGNDDNGNGNVNSNDDDDNGNANSNDDNGNDDNGNGNVNSNDNDDDDDHNGNGNVNSNDDDGDDAHNGNGNVNSNDDDDHSSNGNDDDHGGNSNDDDHGGDDDD